MFAELKEFGLSENEVQVYIALLKLGTSTANRISEVTAIKRSTTYDNVQLLTSKGLISTITKGNVNHFTAAQPSKIVALLEERSTRVKSIVPELEKLQGIAKHESGVVYYEGKKGVLAVLNDILHDGKELWFYGSRLMARDAFQHFPDNFIQKRIEKKIHLRAVLAGEDKNDKRYSEPKVKKFSKMRYSQSLNGVETNVFIYGDKVAFMTSSSTPVGIIVHDVNVVAQQKLMFELIWKQSIYKENDH